MIFIQFLFFHNAVSAQLNLGNQKVQAIITSHGTIQNLSFKVSNQWSPVDFRTDEFAGPAFHVNHEPVSLDFDRNSNSFFALQFGIAYRLSYDVQDGNLVIRASIENTSWLDFKPTSAGLVMGLDAMMESYPQWDNKHFPTLLRAEKTHFWGYARSPLGSIVGIASPDSVASWSINYFKDHYIKTFNLDLLNANPLPQRHPHTLNILKPKEKREWTIYLCSAEKEEDLKPVLSVLCKAPMIEAKGAYTLSPTEHRIVDVYSKEPVTARWIKPDSTATNLLVSPAGADKWTVEVVADENAGQCRLLVSTKAGKQSEALFYQRKPWSYYLGKARDEVLQSPPRPHIYAESYYSAFSIYLGKRYVPNPVADPALDSIFRRILPEMFSYKDGKLFVIPGVRVQSLYTGIAVLTDAYEAYHRIEDLDLAARLADHLAENYQKIDDAYRNIYGVYYSAVEYGTNPVFELAAIEQQLGKKDTLWQNRAQRHYRSAKRAVDDLLKRLDNIDTEGELTFEDGMISCSALQLGYYALHTNNKAEREQFLQGLRYMLNKHRCLEQTVIPDARMNGGTLRFWEAWYDLRLQPHLFNSPHGWSSWKTYATYYMYLLTGEEQWLKETMDAVGSAMQVIDVKRDGYLNWGFVPNPYVEATFPAEDPDKEGTPVLTKTVIGEEYRPLIQRWHNKHRSDNTVHEHFKMLAEVALPNAFVVEHEDGSFLTYNCSVKKVNGVLQVTPYEKLVTNVHFNLLKNHKADVHFSKGNVVKKLAPGMQWLYDLP